MTELSLHILDIAQNSIRAKASLIEISITENPADDRYEISISDNGPGMDEQTLNRAESPFFTSRKTRKVGLGIPLLKHNAEQCGGSLEISSEEGHGVCLNAWFGFHHVDRPVLGDIAGALLILMTNENQTELVYTHRSPGGTYTFDTREVKLILEGTNPANPEIRSFLHTMIRENLEQIQISE
ncbi:ATP-binding protein [Gaoshiqia sp. Z1-71]|uniref:ATP-binding protein n=1 Tax=Gaoshiqia hydrogeniformans TaxID=3290090 RepID=UPI003BF8EA89